MRISFGYDSEGYNYSMPPTHIPGYCSHCGVPIEWVNVHKDQDWKTFDVVSGKRYKYQRGQCPIQAKQLDKAEANRSILSKFFRRIFQSVEVLHIGNHDEHYYRRHLQSNLEVLEEQEA